MNSEQLKQLENNLWAVADNLRAITDLKSCEYATPILGLIFHKFTKTNTVISPGGSLDIF